MVLDTQSMIFEKITVDENSESASTEPLGAKLYSTADLLENISILFWIGFGHIFGHLENE